MGEHRSLVQATVVGVNDASVLYPCCIQCYAKMLHNMHSNIWQCVRCSTSCGQSDLHWRYRLSLCVADSSASCNLVLFGGTLVQHFGCSADQFHEFLRVHQENIGCMGEHAIQQAIQTALVGNAYIFCLKTNAPPQHSVSWQTLQTQPSISRPLCLANLLKLNTHPSQQQHSGKQSDFIAVQMIPTNAQDASGFLTVMGVLTETMERSGNVCLTQGAASLESVKCFQHGTSLRAGRPKAQQFFNSHRISVKGKLAASGEKHSRSFRAHIPHLFEKGSSSFNCSHCAMNCSNLTSSLSASFTASSSPSQSSVSSPQASAMFSCQSSMDREFALGMSLTCSNSCLQSSGTNSQENRSQNHIGGSGKEDRQKKVSDFEELLFEGSSTSMADFGIEQGSLMLKASCSHRISGEKCSMFCFGSSQTYNRTKYEHQNLFCGKPAEADQTCKGENDNNHVTNYSENFIDENNSASDETVLADFSSVPLETDSDTCHSLYPSSESALCEEVEDQLDNKIQLSLNVSFKDKNSSFSTSVNDSSLLLAAFEMDEHVPVKSDQPSHTANEQLLPGEGTETDLCVTSRELSLPRAPVAIMPEGTTTLSASIEMPDSEDLSQFLNVMAGELAPSEEQIAENVSLIPSPRLDVNKIETTVENYQEKGSKNPLLCNTRSPMNTEVCATNSAARTIKLAAATTRNDSATTSTGRSVRTASNLTTAITRSAFRSATTTTASGTTASVPTSTTSSTQIQIINQTEKSFPVSAGAFIHISFFENNSLCGSPVKSFPHSDASSSDHDQSLTSVSVKHTTNYENEPPINHLHQQYLTHVPGVLDMPNSEDLDVFLNNLGPESKNCCASKDPQNCCLLVGNKVTELPNSLNAGRHSSVGTSASQDETVISLSIQRKSFISAVGTSAQLPNSETGNISVVGDSFLGGSFDLFSSQSQLPSQEMMADPSHDAAECKNTTNSAISSTSLSEELLSSDHHSKAGEVHHTHDKCSTAVISQQSATDNTQSFVYSPNVTTVENSVENDSNAFSFSSEMSSFSACARGEVEVTSPFSLSEQYYHRVYQGTSVAELPKKVRFSRKRRVSSVKMIDFRLEKYSNPNGDSQLILPVQLVGNLNSNTPQRSCLRQPLSLVLTPTDCRTVGNNLVSEKKERNEQHHCGTPSQPGVSRQSVNFLHCEIYGTSEVAKTSETTLLGPQLLCSTPCNPIPRAFTDTMDCSGSQDLFSPVLSEDQFGIASSMKATEMSTRKQTPQSHDGTVNRFSGMENSSHIMEERLCDEREVLYRSKKLLSCGKKRLSSRRKNRLNSGRENMGCGREKRLKSGREHALRTESGRRESLTLRRERCVREMSNTNTNDSGQEILSCGHGKRLSFEKGMLSSGREKDSCVRGSKFKTRSKATDDELSPLAATTLEPLDGHRSMCLLDDSMVLFDESTDSLFIDKESVFDGSDDLFCDDSNFLPECKPPDPDQVSTPCSRKMVACVNEANSTSTASKTSDLSAETQMSRRTELYSSFLMSPDLFSP